MDFRTSSEYPTFFELIKQIPNDVFGIKVVNGKIWTIYTKDYYNNKMTQNAKSNDIYSNFENTRYIGIAHWFDNEIINENPVFTFTNNNEMKKGLIEFIILKDLLYS